MSQHRRGRAGRDYQTLRGTVLFRDIALFDNADGGPEPAFRDIEGTACDNNVIAVDKISAVKPRQLFVYIMGVLKNTTK
jgi:hypothetical protein